LRNFGVCLGLYFPPLIFVLWLRELFSGVTLFWFVFCVVSTTVFLSHNLTVTRSLKIFLHRHVAENVPITVFHGGCGCGLGFHDASCISICICQVGQRPCIREIALAICLYHCMNYVLCKTRSRKKKNVAQGRGPWNQPAI
jgi:hypothetical protein